MNNINDNIVQNSVLEESLKRQEEIKTKLLEEYNYYISNKESFIKIGKEVDKNAIREIQN